MVSSVADNIDPARWYTLGEARRFFPSRADGGCVTTATINRWRKLGLFSAVERTVGKRTFYYVTGEQIVKLLGRLHTASPEPPPTPAMAARDAEASLHQSREFLRSRRVAVPEVGSLVPNPESEVLCPDSRRRSPSRRPSR